jgi:DNA-binding HxlR family transcriptional regulator
MLFTWLATPGFCIRRISAKTRRHRPVWKAPIGYRRGRGEPVNQSQICPAEKTAKLIGGRWKIVILWYLFQGVKRFSELHRALDGVSQKVLTQQLRDMERDGIVARTVYAQVPLKVEYSITPLGLSLKPVVEAMHQWGVEHQSSDK